MIRAVLDTNVLASGFLRPHSVPGTLLRFWQGEAFHLVVSEPILEELRGVFADSYFAERLSPGLIADDLALLRGKATLTPITVQVEGVATHPEDDLILATAASAQVDYLVTGDKKLQTLLSYASVSIVSPRGFLNLLERKQTQNDEAAADVV